MVRLSQTTVTPKPQSEDPEIAQRKQAVAARKRHQKFGGTTIIVNAKSGEESTNPRAQDGYSETLATLLVDNGHPLHTRQTICKAGHQLRYFKLEGDWGCCESCNWQIEPGNGLPIVTNVRLQCATGAAKRPYVDIRDQMPIRHGNGMHTKEQTLICIKGELQRNETQAVLPAHVHLHHLHHHYRSQHPKDAENHNGENSVAWGDSVWH